MSHFPVLVIGDNPKRQLRPYHEFECTGWDDEYVREVDVTDDYRKDYEAETDRMLVSPEGERFNYYDERFYTRVPTEEERVASARKPGENFHETPAGWTEVDVPTIQLKSFLQHCLDHLGYDDPKEHILRPGQERTEKHQFNFIEVDENNDVVRVVKRTNPDYKWDWWQLGGRFGRFFKLKPDVKFDIDRVGGGDLYTKESSFYPDSFDENDPWTKRNRAEWVAKLTEAHSTDHAQVREIDFEATRARAEAQARETFGRWRAIYERHGRPLPLEHFEEVAAEGVRLLEEKGIADEQVKSLFNDWNVTRAHQETERARKLYAEQPAIVAERNEFLCGPRQSPIEWFGFDEEAYAKKMRNRSMVPYAVVKDGEWYAKGEMGWFAFSDDHMTDEEWCAKVHEMYDELDPDTWLTLVDCHI